jgi:FkbM family methyltransferase
MKSTVHENQVPAIALARSKISQFFNHYVLHPCLGLLVDIRGGTFEIDGCKFFVPRGMTTVGWRGACCWKGGYEADERKLVKQFLLPDDKVVELGACMGVVSCTTNKLLKNRAHHLVVEANPFLIPWLFRNREANNAGFIVEHCAVGKPPEVTFFVNPSVIVEGTTQQKTGAGFRLPSRSLTELNERYGPFNTLIMDIEGAEGDVLEEAQDSLPNYRLAVIEFHDWIIGETKAAACRQILAKSGLHLVKKSGFTEAWQRG